MSPKTRKAEFDSTSFYTTKSKAKLLAKGLDSARRRGEMLKSNR